MALTTFKAFEGDRTMTKMVYVILSGISTLRQKNTILGVRCTFHDFREAYRAVASKVSHEK